ncbi:hypothetical protein ACLX1H_006628 [Fusarium chlamydosporum]
MINASGRCIFLSKYFRAEIFAPSQDWFRDKAVFHMLCATKQPWAIWSEFLIVDRENVDEQNNPDSDLEVLITNVPAMSTGVNLHKSCHIGIFLNWHLNATLVEQTFALIDRPGQKNAQIEDWLRFEDDKPIRKVTTSFTSVFKGLKKEVKEESAASRKTHNTRLRKIIET